VSSTKTSIHKDAGKEAYKVEMNKTLTHSTKAKYTLDVATTIDNKLLVALIKFMLAIQEVISP